MDHAFTILAAEHRPMLLAYARALCYGDGLNLRVAATAEGASYAAFAQRLSRAREPRRRPRRRRPVAARPWPAPGDGQPARHGDGGCGQSGHAAVTARKELASFKGQYLVVGLQELDPEICRALAVPQSLSAAQEIPGRRLSCSAAVTRISATTVKAIADSRLALNLPNLVKISPKPLLALLEKEDVLMPLLENLELIPEPDGSGTDDFVIPEGLEERQLLRHEQMREHFGLGE